MNAILKIVKCLRLPQAHTHVCTHACKLLLEILVHTASLLCLLQVDGQVVARPMMYLALTYDHRMIDGREAVLFLKSVANKIEDPSRILLDV